MASLWPGKPSTDSLKDIADVADTGLADVGLPAPQQPSSTPMGRPQLQRNQPQPPPPHQPPPPPAPQAGNPNDSLSLMQLRRIVTEFPKIDPTSYAFTYADSSSFEEEVDEWFSYNDAEYKRLQRAQDTFERRWQKFSSKPWLETDEAEQQKFIEREVNGLLATDLRRRCKSLQTILHIILGVWDETAGVKGSGTDAEVAKAKTKATPTQLEHMKSGIKAVARFGGISLLVQVMQNAFKRLWDDDFRETKLLEEDILFIQDELDNVTTIIYLVIEGIRNDPVGLDGARSKVLEMNPGLVDYFVTITARLRWDEANELPQTRIFLLFWKSILLVFGGTPEIDVVKKATSEFKHLDGDGGKLITASPLDYHIFRQEITSKYPAYTPPPPLLALEPDNNSILPPLPNRPSRANGANGIIPPPMNVNSSGASILHQPVHIATPAPSPPPSPPVGGKAGKKQNYQTNQNFPFMYPPLDSTSNSAGGKGSAGLQEFLVGRKWEGSDIPKSILEAGDLFSKRMRMTRAMRQLWDERERFLKSERGWDGQDDDIEELDLDTILSKKLSLNEPKRVRPEVDYGPNLDIPEEVKQKLDLVELFYQDSLPHLQSLVIVLLKAVLANVTALITQPMAQQPGLAPGFRSEVNLRTGVPAQNRQQDPANIPLPMAVDPSELPIDEIEALRSREITAKAVSGILLILLKWFKVSNILKFEYLTQLLLDSNYLPLVLKLFAHQEIDKVVDNKTDRDEMSFFAFCNANSKQAAKQLQLDREGEESEDEAAPPPIKMRRELPVAGAEDKLPALTFQEGQHAGKRPMPEVDELGYPTSEPPSEPITEFSWRNFFSSINFLRVMQKICKNKAHRNLLLVQYKSSNILKKSLKIPQPELRLYTLKLFKNQVPYCGRKWRQGNMRVITAVYLHCRPELRDDWLAGSDVDAEVEEALPLEQALRALTHWHNIKRYPDQMGADTKLLEEEHDFFVRELEKMEWIDDGIGEGESVADSGWDGVNNGW
ncbi:pheromone-dependent cell cycle arrest protein-like protein Far11 [Mollisia scopiformis]|uniref:Pheromone-dependent cell cycle arrest protein-like protein Far11 n=1 Tax=Mollisia scopiformis TaxID=149040 RepID=A0A194WU76_MOLSC|nr:pheromone-dependent cell cycle arrest protein-like protein Far11 [Mollisia scopiformis]KUJ11508.1 pheromone-dependent cell cycle arrest protein-like protein Far11 [Mollisia scopiformis]